MGLGVLGGVDVSTVGDIAYPNSWLHAVLAALLSNERFLQNVTLPNETVVFTNPKSPDRRTLSDYIGVQIVYLPNF